MPVPDYESLMLPALRALSDRAEARIKTVRARIAVAEKLTSDDLNELLPSGKQSVFLNRVSWAVMYLERAGLVRRVRRAVYKLTEDGAKVLNRDLPRVDLSVLQRYPAFVQWQETVNKPSQEQALPLSQKRARPVPPRKETPEESLHRAHRRLRNTLEADVLDRVHAASPAFLEQVVVKLLIAMGYGGGDTDRGSVTGRSGDGGIDGTIREDALGLDEVYVQAKRYRHGNTVGEGDLRNFAGAIDAAGTTKGVFVTTATFTAAAERYVKRSPKRIVLIDGNELARLMVEYDVGVRVKESYEIKRIDEDFFEQESA